MVEAVGVGFAKTIVCGEHFVLDGAHALAIGLADLKTTATVTTGSGCSGKIDSDAALSADQRTATAKMVALAAQQLGLVEPLDVRFVSNIPLGRGLGSSAAMAVALVRAMRTLTAGSTGGDLAGGADTLAGGAEEAELHRLCTALENIVHGRSSGLDPAAAMAARGVVFRSGVITETIDIARRGALLDARWILADVGTAPPTAVAIAAANVARTRLGAAATSRLVSAVDNATLNAARALAAGDLGLLAASMRVCDEALEQLDVMDDRMRAARAVGLGAGALAMKQTGAGLGGCMLALAPNARITETVTAQLARSGIAAVTVRVTARRAPPDSETTQ